MYKLVALDLDGTLVKSDKTMSPALIQAVQAVAKKVPVLIVTGRHHIAAHPYHHQLGLTTPAICCNGTYVYDFKNQTVVSHNALDKTVAATFIDLVAQQDADAVLYTKDAMLFDANKPPRYIGDFVRWASTCPEAVRPSIEPTHDFKQAIADTPLVWKYVIEGANTGDIVKLPFVAEHFSAEQSWVDRWDFAPKGNSKGNALLDYITSHNIKPSEVVAFGDHHNDVSMLKMVGLGIAMGNADDSIKAVADRMTHGTNNDDHSIADILNELFLS